MPKYSHDQVTVRSLARGWLIEWDLQPAPRGVQGTRMPDRHGTGAAAFDDLDKALERVRYLLGGQF